MSSPRQWAQTHYISSVKAAAKPPSSSNSSGSEGGLVLAHSFLARSITVLWSLSGHPGNSQPLLLTHAPFIIELYTSQNTALDGETPTSFPFPHPYISQLGSMLSEKRPKVESQSLLSLFTTWMPLELVKTFIFPLNGLHRPQSSSSWLGCFRVGTAFSGPHSLLIMLPVGTRKFYIPLLPWGTSQAWLYGSYLNSHPGFSSTGLRFLLQ